MINKHEIGDQISKSIKKDKGLKLVNIKTFININERAKIPPAIMIFQAFAYLAATKLKPVTNRVLNLFFALSAFENFVSMDIKTISEELNMAERSVILALKELSDNNIIIKVAHVSDRRRNDYFINPTAAWKGNSTIRKKVIQKYNKNQLALFGKEELK